MFFLFFGERGGEIGVDFVVLGLVVDGCGCVVVVGAWYCVLCVWCAWYVSECVGVCVWAKQRWGGAFCVFFSAEFYSTAASHRKEKEIRRCGAHSLIL